MYISKHKVLTYVEYRAVSGVFQNIDPPPPFPPELVVLVDFKAIYPGVPPGIFVSFPGVAHFLSFEQICQYPRVPQGKVANPPVTLGSYFPWLEPGEIKIPGVLFHNIIQFLNSLFKF